MLSSIDISKLKDVLTYSAQAPLIFSSGLFLWLFAAFIVIYYLLRKQQTGRLIFVVLFSYYFYYKSSGLYFWLLALVTTSDFCIGYAMEQIGHKRIYRTLLVTLSICINLGLLTYFKYTNFFGEIFSNLIGGNFQPKDIFLPVGISFFTFQSLSYTIDIYRGEIKPLHNLLDYAFYVSFFPQLVAGPIVRAKDFIPQIRKKPVVTDKMIGAALFLIAGGLFKKAVISDYISINFVDRVFDSPTLFSGVENLLATYGYALQIYCDFSGYSDMAIGIALLLGFHFNINFNNPYKSVSVTDFWHRWHISLSTWMRDYVYISLGGNRKGKIRQYLNLLVTMFLCGLWHGASWNFILWGSLHGVALAVNKVWKSIIGRDGKHLSMRVSVHGSAAAHNSNIQPSTTAHNSIIARDSNMQHVSRLRRFINIFLTFNFVCFCWIFFRAHDMNTAFTILGRIFTAFHAAILPQLIAGYWKVLALILLGYALHYVPDNLTAKLQARFTATPLWFKALVMIVIIYIVIQTKSSQIQPFIYFQF
ncbi:MAG TPA: MBOAT family O-acyltransferase [Candidatus Egerieousia sp.]|nr:MBOAT family O-acyltransferase [Candidatus Egerieousia sp.]